MIEPANQDNSPHKPILKSLSTLNNLKYEVDELNITNHNNPIEYDLDNNYNTESTNSDNDNLNLFTKDHPLHKTHCIEFKQKRKAFVPNFVSGLLPRCDRGDREYYCAMMLTLFKPWRSGKDLKAFKNYRMKPLLAMNSLKDSHRS
jgi:hypothetical protein